MLLLSALEKQHAKLRAHLFISVVGVTMPKFGEADLIGRVTCTGVGPQRDGAPGTRPQGTRPPSRTRSSRGTLNSCVLTNGCVDR